jgi:DNA-binding response OmpR family regulator
MRILIAEDDDVSRRELTTLLGRNGHEVMVVVDGTEAWRAFQEESPPQLAILDWMMPKMDGVDVGRLVRQAPALSGAYLILLTLRASKEHIVEGLEAGANDYVAKPFDREELLARVNVGVRIVQLQMVLSAR